ncbi:hypothetical protein DL96DRAFT_1783257, partial [Flagelloscypha sp. PMI_526]
TYHQHRSELVARDYALRVDRRNPSFSEQERTADSIVRKIRAHEAKTVWSVERPETATPWSGASFLTSKEQVKSTKIFQILSKMPKGGLLHAHLGAVVDPVWLLNKAYQDPLFHVRIPAGTSPITGEEILSLLPLTQSSLHSVVPVFAALHQDEAPRGDGLYTSLTDMNYQPGSWIPLKQARDCFSSSLGGPLMFDKWVLESMSIVPNEAYQKYDTVDKVWIKFLSVFPALHGLIHYEPIYEEYLKEFIKSSIADGISYIEVRMNFWHKFIRRSNGKFDFTHSETLQLVDRVVKEFKDELKTQGREHDFLGFRIIYTTVRVITNEQLEWYLDDCFAMKKEFPHLVAGFDFVGAENAGQPIKDFLEPLLAFKRRQEEEGIEIPFVFHAGETEGDGTEADHNLYDAILLESKRIGHGFSLLKHPELIKLCRERDIALEVCPISNEILGLTSSMLMHPLPAFLNHGIPIVLSNDDPGVFGNLGLTYDFFQVLMSSEVSGLLTMAEIARDSFKYSFMEPREKVAAFKSYENKWNEFIAWVIQDCRDM